MSWHLLQLLFLINAKNSPKYSFRGFRGVNASKSLEVALNHCGCSLTSFTIFADHFIIFDLNPDLVFLLILCSQTYLDVAKAQIHYYMYSLYRSPAAFYECLITVVITLLCTTATHKNFLYSCYSSVQLAHMKVQTHNSLEPPLEYNQDQAPLMNQDLYDLFNHPGSYRNIMCFRLVLEGKTGNEVTCLSGLQFLERFLAEEESVVLLAYASLAASRPLSQWLLNSLWWLSKMTTRTLLYI